MIRLFRLAVVVIAACLIHIARSTTGDRRGPVSIEQAHLVFPEARRLGRYDPELDAQEVLSASGVRLGRVLRSAPHTDDLIGYAGPSDVLIGIELDGRVRAVSMLGSRDTPAHVRSVRQARTFWRSFLGWNPQEGTAPPIEEVAGSTLTCLAIGEAVERRLSGRIRSLRFPGAIEGSEVRGLFRRADRTEPDADSLRVLARDGTLLGFVVRTSPDGDNVVGYAGPTEVLIGLDAARRRITGIRLRASYDTEAYVARVREDADFLAELARVAPADWRTLDFENAGFEGVSGATQTSYGVAAAIRQRFARSSLREDAVSLRAIALALIVAGSVWLTFGPWRGVRRIRLAWQVVLVLGFGVMLGDLLSLALLAGWARNGLPWGTAPALIGLVAVALLVPWTTRRQIYCQSLCPHGALQEWLSTGKKLRVRLSSRVRRRLRFVPWLLLAATTVVAAAAPGFDLATMEAFDAWSLGYVALASFGIAGIGLVACLFVPMAYCRFGCPTGALLDFVRPRGNRDRIGRRDVAALVCLALCAGCAVLRFDARDERTPIAVDDAGVVSGSGFGTTWTVRVRDSSKLSPELVSRVRAEIRRIETELSSWSPDSEVTQFNDSETTVPIEVSKELVDLVAYGRELSKATDGAFDLTIGPLLDAWGAGPAGARPEPTASELRELGERIGWKKLLVDERANTLRKTHPALRVDLGSLLQGYALDRVAAILAAAAIGDALIEIGGELRARGAWRVAIEDPRDPTVPLRRVTLRDAALATSGTYRNDRHIVDPVTRRPIAARWSLCAVLRPTGLEADGWATALLTSSARALDLAKRRDVAVLLLAKNGEIRVHRKRAFR